MKGAVLVAFALMVVLKTSVSTSACSKSCAIEASDYDRSCVQASDCVGIAEGDLCNEDCTDCINATINVRAQAQYQSDLSSKVGRGRDCPCPAPPPLACIAGTCSIMMFVFPTSTEAGSPDSGASD